MQKQGHSKHFLKISNIANPNLFTDTKKIHKKAEKYHSSSQEQGQTIHRSEVIYKGDRDRRGAKINLKKTLLEYNDQN